MRSILGCLVLLQLGILNALADGPVSRGTLPPPPLRESTRGLVPAARELVERRNTEALYKWQKSLLPSQLAAWYAAQGMTDPASERRLGEQELPEAAKGYEWRAAALSAGLKESEMNQLQRDKLLIEDVSLKQSFEAYTSPQGPVFITSDSILNAFHVLFEDSFRELEIRRAFELRRQLEHVMTKAREQMDNARNNFPIADLHPGWQHAQLVVGPALRLLGTPSKFFDAEVRDEIEHQVEKIRTGTLVELPAFLNPQTRALMAVDYRRCQPTGFYANTESLQNYFRAVRWLQSIPFRIVRDTELTAIGLLGYATMEDREGAENFFSGYQSILGRPDDPGMAEAAYEFQNFLISVRNNATWSEQLLSKRRWLLRHQYKRDDWKKLHDALSLPPDATDALVKIEFRVLSAFRLPDALVLAKTAQPGKLPSGLTVAVLLGSDFARNQLTVIERKQLEPVIKEALEDWHPNGNHQPSPSLYDNYLDTLAALNLPAEPDAPDFMRGPAWNAKSCQTVLGSWAQMRHTFSLQAKQSAMYLGLVDVPPGFVEPNPAFFGSLADLVSRAARCFETGGVFSSSPEVEALRLRSAAAELESFRFHLPGASVEDFKRLTQERELSYEHAVMSADFEKLIEVQIGFTKEMKDEDFQAFHRELISQLQTKAGDFATGKHQPDSRNSVERERWDTLRSVTRRLEIFSPQTTPPATVDERRSKLHSQLW